MRINLFVDIKDRFGDGNSFSVDGLNDWFFRDNLEDVLLLFSR